MMNNRLYTCSQCLFRLRSSNSGHGRLDRGAVVAIAIAGTAATIRATAASRNFSSLATTFSYFSRASSSFSSSSALKQEARGRTYASGKPSLVSFFYLLH